MEKFVDYGGEDWAYKLLQWRVKGIGMYTYYRMKPDEDCEEKPPSQPPSPPSPMRSWNSGPPQSSGFWWK